MRARRARLLPRAVTWAHIVETRTYVAAPRGRGTGHLAERAEPGQHSFMAEEPLIHREELTATLFAIPDIRESVDEILQTLKEEDDGEEPEADG